MTQSISKGQVIEALRPDGRYRKMGTVTKVGSHKVRFYHSSNPKSSRSFEVNTADVYRWLEGGEYRVKRPIPTEYDAAEIRLIP